jgi:hypothetical protein
MTAKPRYTHDCDVCIFVGHFERYDVHYCPRCDGGSLIMRFSNDGPEYASMPIGGIAANPNAESILVKGLAFARAAGVVP